jgi:hypothetical protein
MKYCISTAENGLCDWCVDKYCTWYNKKLKTENGKLLRYNDCNIINEMRKLIKVQK